MVDQYAAKHMEAGMEARSYSVDALTLSEICRRHAHDREIHFLKIDVEGHEGAALRGMDFKRYRPWVLVIEATEPNRLDILTHDEWDEGVRQSGYVYAGSTLPNRYYVAEEHADLAVYFSLQPDDYERVAQQKHGEDLEHEVSSLRQQLDTSDVNTADPPRRGFQFLPLPKSVVRTKLISKLYPLPLL